MPSARTATTATVRSSTGGICQARVISHAEIPASASALPSDSTPNSDGQQQSRQPRAQQGSRQQWIRGLRHAHLDDLVADRQHRFAVPDDDHRRTGPRPRDDGIAGHGFPCRRPGARWARRAAVPAPRDPSTRARPSRCRWPSDRPTPPRPITVPVRPAASARTSSKPAARQALSRSASGPNSSRLSRDACRGPAPGAARSQDSCRHHAGGSRSATSTRRRVTSPTGPVSPAIACSACSCRRRWGRSARSPGPVRDGVEGRSGGRRRGLRRSACQGDLRATRGDGTVPRRRWAARSARRPCRRRSFRPARHGTPPRCGAAARTRRVPAAGRSGRWSGSISPKTRRSPILTATSATPSVASNSSTNADRNAIRSVAIAERRWAAASSAIRCSRTVGAAQRPQRRDAGDQVQQPSLQGGHRGQRGRGPLARSPARSAP